MNNSKKHNVVVIESSEEQHITFTKVLDKSNDYHLLGFADNFNNAKFIIEKHQTNILIADLSFSGLSDLDSLNRLVNKYHLPVLVIVPKIQKAKLMALYALDSGAADIMTFDIFDDISKTYEFFEDEMIAKLKSSMKINIENLLKPIKLQKSEHQHSQNDIIAISGENCSTLFISALAKIMTENCPPVIALTNLPTGFTQLYSSLLNEKTKIEVKEAETGDIASAGKLFIAPADEHIRIYKQNGANVIECFHGNKIKNRRPSADILFQSVAETCRDRSSGLILSGSGTDGAHGLEALRKVGARTAVLNKNSSILYEINQYCLEIKAAQKEIETSSIPDFICC